MKKFVWWSLLILVVGCHRGGEKAGPGKAGTTSQEGSTAVQSVQSAEPVQTAQTAAEPAPPAALLGQTAETASPAAAKAPTSPIAEAVAKKEVEDVSFESQKSLKGIKEVSVMVWGFLDPEAIKAGLTQDVLFGEVKDKLEKAGIKVLKVGEPNSDAGRATFYVKLDIRKRKNFDVYIGYIDVSLFQYVYLGRNPKQILLSESWTTHSPPFLYGQENLVEFCRQQLQGEMDSFVKDYIKYSAGQKAPSAGPSKSKPAAGTEAAPSSKPSQPEKKPGEPEKKPAASEKPASAPQPAPGGTEKPAGKKP